jgi:hypothetical protein
MPRTLQLKMNAQLGDTSFPVTLQITAKSVAIREPTVTPAKAGTLTGRTDNDTGVVTLGAGHGIVSTNLVDVFWTGGQRRGMTATVVGNDVTVDLGVGDNLPVLNTPVTVKLPQDETDLSLTGANVVAIGVYSPVPGFIVFKTGANAVIAAYPITANKKYDFWFNGSGVTNPVTGQTIAKISFSHSDSAADRTMKAAIASN